MARIVHGATSAALLLSFSMVVSACSEEAYVPNAECSNGAERTLPCGVLQRGERLQRCVQFQWEDAGECNEELLCTPADTRDETCGRNGRGTVKEICGDNTWKPLAECNDPDVCDDGASYEQSCGENGRGLRTVDCVEGQLVLQPCVSTDVCVDGTVESQDCEQLEGGLPTAQSRACVEGQWAPWSECEVVTCDEGDVIANDCGTDGLGVLRQTCVGGQWIESEECEMRGRHVFLNDSTLFVIARDNSLWVSGGMTFTLAGRQVSSSALTNLREPFDERVYIESGEHFAMSQKHACMIELGEVYCWGDNPHGQLGVPSAERNSSRVPLRVLNVGGTNNPAVQVVVTPKVSCARMADGDVRCWGVNEDQGGVGAGRRDQTLPATQPIGFMDEVPPAEQLFARQNMICARVEGGAVYCWGDSFRRKPPISELVLPKVGMPLDSDALLEPTAFAEFKQGSAQLIDLHLHLENSCALYSNHAVYCWGKNLSGEVGVENGFTSGYTLRERVQFSGGLLAQSLYTDAHRRCALMSDGSLHCWGRQMVSADENMRLIPNKTNAVWTPEPTPRFMTVASPVESLSVADMAACAVHEDEVVRCTGVSTTGSFGRGTRIVSQGHAKPVIGPEP